MIASIVKLIFLLLFAPIGGITATIISGLAFGIATGFAFGWRWEGFLNPFAYLPMSKALLAAIPLAYFPAYLLCEFLKKTTLIWYLAGLLASWLPAIVIALDDDGDVGTLWGAWRGEPSRFVREVFEIETLLWYCGFATASIVLTALYRRFTQNRERESG